MYSQKIYSYHLLPTNCNYYISWWVLKPVIHKHCLVDPVWVLYSWRVSPMKEQGKEMSARSGIGDPFLNLVGKTRYNSTSESLKAPFGKCWKLKRFVNKAIDEMAAETIDEMAAETIGQGEWVFWEARLEARKWVWSGRLVDGKSGKLGWTDSSPCYPLVLVNELGSGLKSEVTAISLSPENYAWLHLPRCTKEVQQERFKLWKAEAWGQVIARGLCFHQGPWLPVQLVRKVPALMQLYQKDLKGAMMEELGLEKQKEPAGGGEAEAEQPTGDLTKHPSKFGKGPKRWLAARMMPKQIWDESPSWLTAFFTWQGPLISCTSAVLLGWRFLQEDGPAPTRARPSSWPFADFQRTQKIPTALFGQPERTRTSMVRAAKVWLQMTADGSFPGAAKVFSDTLTTVQ